MQSAWDIQAGGNSSVIVGVLDTGVAYENYDDVYFQAPDLSGTSFVPGYDFINNDSHPNDDEGHGTHVTGTIAQTTNNEMGVAGIAYNCSIMPVKVLDEFGSGSAQSLADGLHFAADNGADVINMSLGWTAGYDPGETVRAAIAYAYNAGVTLVAASGNDSKNTVSYPAAYDDYVIAVGATRYDETIPKYSNTGQSLDIVAPGGDLKFDKNSDDYGDGVLQQTFPNNPPLYPYDPSVFYYYFFQGTSMASPHVAGVAALVIANGVTGPDNVRNALQTTAEDHGTEGWDSEYGWGIVDASAALNYIAIVPIADASAQGLINFYCYTYNGSEYVPISANDDTDISPWTGFWVAVYQDVDLLIPETGQGSATSASLPLSGYPNTNDNKWYLISAPLDVGSNKDVKYNLSDPLNLVANDCGTLWRVYKKPFDSEEYHYYGQDGVTFEELVPGRGFFIKHKYPLDKTISISGSGVDPSGDPGNYELKLPANASGETFHMVGNPYWYGIKWSDCKVRVPMNPGLPLGKVAASVPGEVNEWYIRLKLESLDGTALDTYNRAGIVKSAGINPAYYRAYDIEPMDPYVRLWLQNPSEPERTPLAYDYRAPGLDVYTWEVMLTTTYPQIDARLSIVDLANVPDVYNITLLDTDTGEMYEMNSDNSFDVSLLEESPKMFVLTATQIKENNEAKDDSSDSEKSDDISAIDEETQPVAFGIIDIRPNPFNPATTLNYGLERAGNVKISIYNLNGQLVETLIDAHVSAGRHSIIWNAEGHSSGIYVVLVESGGLIDSRKITLLK